ncbi:unnamed protein product [Ascophyllum nodosum]
MTSLTLAGSLLGLSAFTGILTGTIRVHVEAFVTAPVVVHRHPAMDRGAVGAWRAWGGDGAARRSRVKRAMSMADDGEYDYDVIIVGCGVGGHGAALHARSCGLKTAVFSGKDVGGTCVNRGCVPSKALLAASGRVREMQDDQHLDGMGIKVSGVEFDRAGVAAHAKNLANKVKGGLEVICLYLELFIHSNTTTNIL